MSDRVESAQGESAEDRRHGTFLEVLWVSTRLGLTSFGGPIAHLGYFHEEYVKRRKWIDEQSYADLVALCQFLPGPASSQVSIAIGILRARFLGGLAAWIGFTLAWPSAVGQLSSIVIAGLTGAVIFPGQTASSPSQMRFPVTKKTGIAAWIIFFVLLVGLPFYRQISPSHGLEVFDSFFRAGSLVFGGGHVILPLLQTEVVGPGWVTNEQFVAG